MTRDPAAGFAYFAAHSETADKTVKVRLSNFTRVAGMAMKFGEEYLGNGVIDTARGLAYFVTTYYHGTLIAGSNPAVVLKVQNCLPFR